LAERVDWAIPARAESRAPPSTHELRIAVSLVIRRSFADPYKSSKEGASMAEEHVFLQGEGVYVSNTKVILYGTTYSTANITSVQKRFTPASKGCAYLFVAFFALGTLGSLGGFGSGDAGSAVVAFLICAACVALGVVWLRALKPTYHVVLASSSGERQGLSSKDNNLVDDVIGAISSAITYRG
jgi:Family of unknown function (DUF6232)